jgi:hypothetical protein
MYRNAMRTIRALKWLSFGGTRFRIALGLRLGLLLGLLLGVFGLAVFCLWARDRLLLILFAGSRVLS